METTNTLILSTNISESAFLERSQTTPLNCLNVFPLFSNETWAGSVINADVFKAHLPLICSCCPSAA